MKMEDYTSGNIYMDQIENELQLERNKNLQLMNANQNAFNLPSEDNLIRWQLDLKEDIDKIYHLLRGDVLKEDEHGNMIYVEPTDDSLKPFNEFGVQMIMNIMAFYLNRNTLLSNYDDDTINWKVEDFGNEVSDLILCKYEKMGMNTFEKTKMYPMIVLELVDTVHSAYLRSLYGGERESLRTARTVHQSQPLGVMDSRGNMVNNQMGGQKRFSILNPRTWI
jgi:hypothetical protein